MTVSPAAANAAAKAAGGPVAPGAFVVLVGLGVYLPHVAVHVSLFERLIARSRDRGTSAYLLQLADSFGYLGYAGVLALEAVAGSGLSGRLGEVFPLLVAGMAAAGLALLGVAALVGGPPPREATDAAA